MVDAISTWLHVLAITLWIGPQVFIFAVAVPAVRTIEDAGVRARVMRVLTARLGWLGWTAMAVIIVTGFTNLLVVADGPSGKSVGDLLDLSFDLRFARVFWEKMFLVALAVVLTAVHTFSIGPRQLRLMEDASADKAELRRVRRLSMATSGIALLASIVELYLGAVLSNHSYSLAD